MWLPKEEKALVAKSDPVLRVKEGQKRASLNSERELGVTMGKGSGRGAGIGSPGGTPEKVADKGKDDSIT